MDFKIKDPVVVEACVHNGDILAAN